MYFIFVQNIITMILGISDDIRLVRVDHLRVFCYTIVIVRVENRTSRRLKVKRLLLLLLLLLLIRLMLLLMTTGGRVDIHIVLFDD